MNYKAIKEKYIFCEKLDRHKFVRGFGKPIVFEQIFRVGVGNYLSHSIRVANRNSTFMGEGINIIYSDSTAKGYIKELDLLKSESYIKFINYKKEIKENEA